MLNRYIILPKTFDWNYERSSSASAFSSLHAAARKGTGFHRALGLPNGLNVTVLDSIRAHGPKLIELPPGDAGRFRVARPDLQLVRQVFYQLALAQRPRVRKTPKLAAFAASLKMRDARRDRHRGKAIFPRAAPADRT